MSIPLVVCLVDDRCRSSRTGKFAPPSNMGRGLTHECHHVSTPILAAAIIFRDTGGRQGGTRPAFCTEGMILPDLTPPAWRRKGGGKEGREALC